MTEKWYLYREGEEYGPYTWDEVVLYTREGNIGSQDFLWSQSTADWIQAHQVSGLSFPSFEPSPPPSSKKPMAILAGGSLLAVVLVVFLLNFILGDINGTIVEGEDGSEFWALPAHASHLEGIDDSHWENYPDLQEEKEAISQTMEGFSEALKTGDPHATAPFIFDERGESYRELFSSNPEAMESFGEIITEAEISFLSEHDDSTPENRTAEYSLEMDGFTFYLIFMKVEDSWVLYDF